MSFTSSFDGIPLWHLLLWAVWAGMFGVLDFLGVYHNDRGWLSLTYVIRHSLPGIVIAGALGMLFYHFLIQYKK